MRTGFAKFITADGCERIEAMKEITPEVCRLCFFPITSYEESPASVTIRAVKRHYKLMGALSGDMYEYREVR